MELRAHEAQIRPGPNWLYISLTLFLSAFAIGCSSSSYEFPVRKQTAYFDFRYERNSPQIEPMARFADGYIKLINHDFFKTDFDLPIQAFVLEDQERFEDFVHRELRVPGPAGFGIYLYSKKLLATYEDSGLGTFTHETLHAFVEKDLTDRPAWGDEGIPTFFEKFYGYWKNGDLVLLWGFQNPWRIHELGTSVSQLNLAEIVSERKPEADESKLRMVSLFLWRQGRFRRFLGLIAARDKRGYNSYLEASMELPLDRITPLWRAYLLDVEKRRAAILTLPLSEVFASEAEFQSFANAHGISTEQINQVD